MEWISVKDRIPEVSGAKNDRLPDLCESAPVLAITEYGVMVVAQYATDIDDETGESTRYWYIKGIDVIYGVTHWMPLPEPPK